MLWLTLLSLALVATLDLPFVFRAVGSVAPATTNVGHLLKYLLALTAAAGAYEIVRSGYLPPGRAESGLKARLAAAGLVLAVLTVLFAVAPVHERQVDSLTAAYAGIPAIRAFLAVFLVTLSALLVSIARHTGWYRRQLPVGPLRTSMTLILAAAVAGLLFTLDKALLVAFAPVFPGYVAAAATSPLSSVLLAVSLLLFATGTAWHVLGSKAPGKHLRTVHRDRQLQRLWQDLRDVVPSISLEDALARRHESPGPRVGHHRFPVARHEVELRYWRRVMEILDGELTLRPYVADPVHEVARELARRRGVPERDVDPVAERAVLEVARRRRARGERPAPGRAAPQTPARSSFDAQARRLHAIASHRSQALAVAEEIDHVSTVVAS